MNSIEELKDAVAETLETKGVLGKVKAQLRASVFSAIQEDNPDGHGYLANPRAADIRNNADARLVAELILEFMEFYELDFSQSVFTPECNLTQTFGGRDSLLSKLSVSNVPNKTSVLQHILESYRNGGGGGGGGENTAPNQQQIAAPTRPEADLDAEMDAMLQSMGSGAAAGASTSTSAVEEQDITVAVDEPPTPGSAKSSHSHGTGPAGDASTEGDDGYEDEGFEEIEEDIDVEQSLNSSTGDNPLTRSNEDVLKSLPPAVNKLTSLAPVGMDSVNSITSPVPSVKDMSASFDNDDRHQHSSDFEASMDQSTGLGSHDFGKPAGALGSLAPLGGPAAAAGAGGAAGPSGTLPPLRGRTQLAPIGGGGLAPIEKKSVEENMSITDEKLKTIDQTLNSMGAGTSGAGSGPDTARSKEESDTVSQKTADESWNGGSFGSDDDIVEDIETVDVPSDDDIEAMGSKSGNISLGQSQDMTLQSSDFQEKYEYYESAEPASSDDDDAF